MVYDIDGNDALSGESEFTESIRYEYQRDEETGIFYTIMNIPQTLPNGKKQYPFVYYPNYPNGGIESPLELNRRKKFLAVFSGGRFASPWGPGVSVTGLPKGTIIQNSIDCTVLENDRTWDRVLTIDNNGALSYAELDTQPSTLISNGIVSAFTGFIPLIIDFKNAEEVDNTIEVTDNTEIAQRIAICQYDTGDYAVIGVEARGIRSATGDTTETLSFKGMQRLCKGYGVKFAFAFDGGGSSAMTFGQNNLLPLYDAPNGRKIPVYIVFNGSTEFPG